MRLLLAIFSVLAFLGGASILAAAQSALHEIEAFVLFLISSVFLSGAAIVEGLSSLGRKVDKLSTKT